jgi:hypothetical protein
VRQEAASDLDLDLDLDLNLVRREGILFSSSMDARRNQ